MLIRHTFPMDAEYEFTVGGGFGGGGGGGGAATDITMDGMKVEVRNTRSFRLPFLPAPIRLAPL